MVLFTDALSIFRLCKNHKPVFWALGLIRRFLRRGASQRYIHYLHHNYLIIMRHILALLKLLSPTKILAFETQPNTNVTSHSRNKALWILSPIFRLYCQTFGLQRWTILKSSRDKFWVSYNLLFLQHWSCDIISYNFGAQSPFKATTGPFHILQTTIIGRGLL